MILNKPQVAPFSFSLSRFFFSFGGGGLKNLFVLYDSNVKLVTHVLNNFHIKYFNISGVFGTNEKMMTS